MTAQYFDPRARRVSVSTAPPPRAVSVPAPVPGVIYWDRSLARRSTRFPSEEEILAAYSALEPAAIRSLESIVALPWHSIPGETALGLFRRRVAACERCHSCRAIAGGDYGHRRGCRIALQEDTLRNKWWLRRRKKVEGPEVEVEVEEDDDGLPF